jgi:hypothetical protein
MLLLGNKPRISCQGSAMAPSRYEIRIAGVLPPEALLDFDLTSAVAPVETVLCGEIADSAALQGLLARFDTFGVHLIEVRRLHQ